MNLNQTTTIPSGKNIHRLPKATEKDEWGVMPDEGYEVKLSNEEMDKLYDARREREVVRKKEEAPKSTFVDRQMAKAVSYLVDQLAGKPDAEKPANAEEKDKDKPEKSETKKEGASLDNRLGPAYGEAILEWLSTLQGLRSRAA